MNKVILCGRLGADAELKMTQTGQSLMKLRLATSEKFTDKQGQKKETTQWHSCTMWGDRASKLAQYCEKGKQVIIEGQIEYSSYEKDGEKRYRTDIKVFNLEFVGGGKAHGEPDQDPNNGADTEDFPNPGDDGVPF